MPPYAVLALIAGIGIPVMAAMNSNLGERLSSPAAASLILFCVGAASSLIVLFIFNPPAKNLFSAAPPIYYFGGVLVAFYILSITWIAPRFGVGNAIFFVLLGQIISATAIDHFGLFGMPAVAVETRRIFGIVLMAAGVFMARI
ncbi:MAG: DMT family transporter [Gammaproteobacteria bacterium]|nr:DMT family transporter [Gammaproteobacteria bacterium]